MPYNIRGDSIYYMYLFIVADVAVADPYAVFRMHVCAHVRAHVRTHARTNSGEGVRLGKLESMAKSSSLGRTRSNLVSYVWTCECAYIFFVKSCLGLSPV